MEGPPPSTVSSLPMDRNGSSIRGEGSLSASPQQEQHEQEQEQQEQRQEHPDDAFVLSPNRPQNKDSPISVSTACSVPFGIFSLPSPVDVEPCGETFERLIDAREGKGHPWPSKQHQKQRPPKEGASVPRVLQISSKGEALQQLPQEKIAEPTTKLAAAETAAETAAGEHQRSPLLLPWGPPAESFLVLVEDNEEESYEDDTHLLNTQQVTPNGPPQVTSNVAVSPAPSQRKDLQSALILRPEDELDIMVARDIRREFPDQGLAMEDLWQPATLQNVSRDTLSPFSMQQQSQERHQQQLWQQPQHQEPQQQQQQQQPGMECLWAQPWLWSYPDPTPQGSSPGNASHPLSALQHQKMWGPAGDYSSPRSPSKELLSGSCTVDARPASSTAIGGRAAIKQISPGKSLFLSRDAPTHALRGLSAVAGAPEVSRWWSGARESQEAFGGVGEKDLQKRFRDPPDLGASWDSNAASAGLPIISGASLRNVDLLQQQLGFASSAAATAAISPPTGDTTRDSLSTEVTEGPSSKDPLWVWGPQTPVEQGSQQGRSAAQLLQAAAQQQALPGLNRSSPLETPSPRAFPEAKGSRAHGRWAHRGSSNDSLCSSVLRLVVQREDPEECKRANEAPPFSLWIAAGATQDGTPREEGVERQQLQEQRLVLLQRDEEVLSFTGDTSNNELRGRSGEPSWGTRAERRRQPRQGDAGIISFRAGLTEEDAGRLHPLEAEVEYRGLSPHRLWEKEQTGVTTGVLPFSCANTYRSSDVDQGIKVPPLFTDVSGAFGGLPWLAPADLPDETVHPGGDWLSREDPQYSVKSVHPFSGPDFPAAAPPPKSTSSSSSGSTNVRSSGFSNRELVDLAGLMLSLQMQHDAASLSTSFDPDNRVVRRGSATAAERCSSSSRGGESQSAKGGRWNSDSVEAQQRATYTLIVNVPPNTTRQDLLTTFSAFGRVELTVVVCDKEHRHPNREWTATSGYGFVRFVTSDEAATAVHAAAMGAIRLRGSRIRATWARKDSLAKHSLTSGFQGPAPGPRQVMLASGRAAQMQSNSSFSFTGLHPLLGSLPPLLSERVEHLLQEQQEQDQQDQQQQQRGQQQSRRRHRHSRPRNEYIAEAPPRNLSPGR